MAVIQFTLRDTQAQVREFLEACGVDTAFLRPLDSPLSAVRIAGAPLDLSFASFVPLVATEPSQRVLDVLEPDLPMGRQSAFWGSSGPTNVSMLRLRVVEPATQNHPHPSWRGTGGELLEIGLRMVCRGVPLTWFRAAATQGRWTKMLWMNDKMDPAPWVPMQYGGAFASWDGDYDEVISSHPGPRQSAFLTFNDWITSPDFSLDPIVADDPALRNTITGVPAQ